MLYAGVPSFNYRNGTRHIINHTFQLVSVLITMDVAPASAVSPSSVHLGVTSLPCISTVPEVTGCNLRILKLTRICHKVNVNLNIDVLFLIEKLKS